VTILRIARLALAVIAVCLATTSISLAGDTRLPPPKGVGDVVPPMILADLDGTKRELTSAPWEGPVLVFFWSVYCPNCKDAMPHLIRLYKNWVSRGITIWAINVDGERFSNAVRAYVHDMALPFPVVLDRLEGEFLVAADALGVSKTPTVILAGSNGRILLRQAIDVEYEVIEHSLEALSR
jgi:thiol-disulfide isomerase/thioredoxin